MTSIRIKTFLYGLETEILLIAMVYELTVMLEIHQSCPSMLLISVDINVERKRHLTKEIR